MQKNPKSKWLEKKKKQSSNCDAEYLVVLKGQNGFYRVTYPVFD